MLRFFVEDAKMKRVLIVLTIFCMALAGGAKADLQEGMVGYWSMDASTIDDMTVQDSGPNAYDGTLNNAPVEVPGVLGEALDLEGAYIALGNLTDWAATNQLSISLWAKWKGDTDPADNWRGLCGKRTGWNGTADVLYWYLEIGSDDLMGFSSGPNGWAGATYTLPTDEWAHVVVTFDGTNAALYVDGALIGGPYALAFGNDVDAETVIGAVQGDGSNDFNGALDEVGFWNRALTEDEIAELYNGGKGATPFGNQWRATNIAPLDGTGGIPSDIDVILEWGPPTVEPPEPITRYDIYFSDVRSVVADINDLILPTASVLAGETLEYNAGTLLPAEYYGRVDAVISDHDPYIAYGKGWSFDTFPEPPEITLDPVGLMAAAGRNVTYTCQADP